MSRFQALTNSVLDQELESLRQSLGLEPSQRAELLREIAALAAWVVRQAASGRAIQARRGLEIEQLAHPAIERLLAQRSEPVSERWVLTDEEALRFAAVLDRPFKPSAELRSLLDELADPDAPPPQVVWKKAG